MIVFEQEFVVLGMAIVALLSGTMLGYHFGYKAGSAACWENVKTARRAAHLQETHKA